MDPADPRPLTLGTAGHVDHGKTTLVRALTGTDTDRLPEEKQRGLSIDLGYALLELPSGRRLSLVDVPGHQRFVRTMVAGATGIDLFLITVAADDGVMPQTREHARVLAGLGIERGVAAITKADAAEPTRALAETAALMPGIDIVPVSARTGLGLGDLLAALDRVASGLPATCSAGEEARLHVDRSFTINGAGTVVTGTLWSGQVARGDTVALLPQGVSCRVRAVHLHGQEVQSAAAGQRVALNLVGVSRNDVSRGDVVASPATDMKDTRCLAAELEPGVEIESGDRVQVHHGTRESAARVRRLPAGGWQLRLERPLLAAAGDRLVVRRIAPPETLGGGVITDTEPEARGDARREERPQPAAPPPRPEPLSPRALELEQSLRQAGAEPPLDSELAHLQDELAALREAGRAVRVGPRLHFHADALASIEAQLTGHLAEHPSITLAELRDQLHTSRKFAQALLEHFNGAGLTRRLGDEHVLRRRHTERTAEKA